RLFAAKTARSISEIQQSVNNMADVMVFLEVLGYDERTAKKNGYAGMQELAEHIYEFVDVYDGNKGPGISVEPVPSRGERLAESLSMIFPWMGSLILLFVTGVSLWMAWGLPTDITTMFLAGVFLGLFLTEGLLQNFHRLFSFYYSQTNIGEVKRSITRTYVLAGTILCSAVAGIFGLGALTGIPFELAAIASTSMVTISLHRLSYVILYALKKVLHITVSYIGAFAVLLAVFFLLPGFIPDVTVRYFVGLGTAFAVLSSFAMYHHYKIIGQSSTAIVAQGAPHFYSPLTVNDNTIASRFGVQLWECMPFFLYGTFYFVILFADRIISWFFNPAATTTANAVILPLSFNSVYHIGADLALLIVLPAAIIQYVIASPIYLLVRNRAVNLKVFESGKIDLFLRYSYRRLLLATVVVSISGAISLNLAAPVLIRELGGTAASLWILNYASAGAVFLSVYAANAVFLIFLNRVKALSLTSLASALVVTAGGFVLATQGFENIVLAYLAGTILAATGTSVILAGTLKNAGSRLFARYI
ncbi:MAG TPA: hypothetical protein VLA68_06115, partial [Nitrososphaera sp.]|nr:hypothetical protein [Nitrososphaera sp.]